MSFHLDSRLRTIAQPNDEDPRASDPRGRHDTLPSFPLVVRPQIQKVRLVLLGQYDQMIDQIRIAEKQLKLYILQMIK